MARRIDARELDEIAGAAVRKMPENRTQLDRFALDLRDERFDMLRARHLLKKVQGNLEAFVGATWDICDVAGDVDVLKEIDALLESLGEVRNG